MKPMVTYTLGLITLSTVSLAINFEIISQFSCKEYCIDLDWFYYSNTEMTAGRCCDLKNETEDKCK